jgi:hypothetical protein
VGKPLALRRYLGRPDPRPEGVLELARALNELKSVRAAVIAERNAS